MFIRAPAVMEMGPGVEALATYTLSAEEKASQVCAVILIMIQNVKATRASKTKDSLVLTRLTFEADCARGGCAGSRRNSTRVSRENSTSQLRHAMT